MQNQTLTSYELHIFRTGAWKIDSIYDDKELAIDMAKRVLDSRRTTAARVIEENFVNGVLKTRTVFRRSLVDYENAEARGRKLQAYREARLARQYRPAASGRHAAASSTGAASQSFTWLLLKLFGIGIIGFLAFLFLTHIIAFV